MKRVRTWVGGQQVASADLNSVQDRALGLVAASVNNDLSALPDGMGVIEWQHATQLADATEVKVDAGAVSDWTDRILFVLFRSYSNGNWQPGGADDHQYDSATLHLQKGYTGNGALNGAASAAPSNGDPPVPASGVSWAVQLTTDIWLYAKASDGALYLYNDSGSTIFRANLTVFATAQTGKR